MNYTLTFSHGWEKEYKKLDAITKKRVEEALQKIIENPFQAKPLTGNLKGYWSYRIGNYRLIYLINDLTATIFVYAIGLRKNIYNQ